MIKLFCFTYAGGTASFFDCLNVLPNYEIELIKLEYAGHGVRHGEPFYNSFTEVAQDMYRQIKDVVGNEDDYSLFGYSMGSISAVETLRLIATKKEIPLPKHVFLGAHGRRSMCSFNERDLDNIDEAVKKKTLKFGGIPDSLISNKSFWRMYLPIYKSDYNLIEKYDFSCGGFQTEIPATIFYSETDTPFYTVKEWEKVFKGICNFIRYDGEHFFIKEHSKEIMRNICDVLFTNICNMLN